MTKPFPLQIERELVVPAESPVVIEPRKSSFHNPSLSDREIQKNPLSLLLN